MEKYVDILAAIANTRAAMVDPEKSEKEFARNAVKIAYKTGTDAELAAAEAAYEAAEEKYAAECKHNEDLKIALEILKDNAANAFFVESIGTICTIWNKYAGKPHGEKTAEKIRKELFEALGVRVYIANKYDDACITCYDLGRNAPFRQLEFYASRKAGENIPALVDNKVQALNPDCFRLYCCGGYVDDVPAQVEAIRAAHDKAREAEAAFSAAVSAYNNLTRGNIVRASTREGVKSWLI